jgi:hypothetical protein
MIRPVAFRMNEQTAVKLLSKGIGWSFTGSSKKGAV